ncbi:MAG: vWA domain-containing protein [Pseudomonadota bacterium]
MSDQQPKRSSFLRTLRDDTAANTIVIAAASLVPLIGMVGGAVDSSRYYMAASRLQAACDAGALAARRAMQDDTFAPEHKTVADNFFKQNYPEGTFGLKNLDHQYVGEDDGTVLGTATGEMPTSLMGMFGYEEFDLSVSCTAEINISNTDIMFVLDVTGSMGSSLDGGTRISALRTAVMNFYDTVEQATSDSAQVRYGVVPYNSNVNVGASIPTSYMATTNTYNSRVAQFDKEIVETTTTTPTGDWQFESATIVDLDLTDVDDFIEERDVTLRTGVGRNWCRNREPDDYNEFVDVLGPYGYVSRTTTDTTRTTRYNDTNEDFLFYEGFWRWERNGGGSNRRCEHGYKVYEATGDALWDLVETRGVVTTTTTEEVIEFERYVYQPVDLSAPPSNNVDGGDEITERPSWAGVNLTSLYDDNQIDMPLGDEGAMTTVTWDGCIEEASTQNVESFDPIPTGAFDLDINLKPTTEEQKWKPVLRNASWLRNDGGWTRDNVETTSSNNQSRPGYTCPASAFRLTDITRGDLQTYVNSLSPNGFTYHDIGMIWGARFVSPNGIFGADNSAAPNGDAIARHIVFMTDGTLVPRNDLYGTYGIEWWDRRVTSNGSNDQQRTRHANRFQAACTAARNENVSVWVVAFGTTLTQNLIDCASPGRAYSAGNADSLNEAFQEIAQKIAALRLTS